MKNKLLVVLTVFIGLFAFSSEKTSMASTAVQDAPKVLLVYDSCNARENKEKDVDTLVRILMSMGRQVTLVSMNDYQAGQLEKGKYEAVVTMINWPSMDFENAAFEKDRQNFKGKKLHVGSNLTKSEQQGIPGQWVTLNEQSFTLTDSDGLYEEQLSFQNKIQLLLKAQDGETVVSNLVSKTGDQQSYPFGIVKDQNAYIPLFSSEGATLLSSMQLIAKWLGVKDSYTPYVAIENFTPLSSFTVADKFVRELEDLENNVIITTTSTTDNTDTKTFKAYLKFLKIMTNNNHAILYLNVPALNASDSGNNDTLEEMMTQEVSTLIENQIFPLGISAPTYWNFDKYYQMNALDFGDAVLFTGMTNSPHFHTRTNTTQAFKTTFFNVSNDALANVHWNKNGGKYTAFTFPVPTVISYQFPKTVKQNEKLFKEIRNDPFPPTDQYLYRFNTGISTQTQNLRGANGTITLNDVPVDSINFDALQKQTNVKTNNTKQSKASTSRNIVDKVNDVLTVIILITLAVLVVLLLKGRKLYLRMFKNHDSKK